jgi:hypothetical protein
MAVLRSALLFTPFWLVTLSALALILREIGSDGATAGRIVGTVLVGLVALLLTYQVVQSVRDLFASPVETTGVVERHWSRNEVLIFRNSYIFVQGNVFRLSPEQAIEVDRGDTVRVVHFPHTSTVEAVEVVSRAGAQTRKADG